MLSKINKEIESEVRKMSNAFVTELCPDYTIKESIAKITKLLELKEFYIPGGRRHEKVVS